MTNSLPLPFGMQLAVLSPRHSHTISYNVSIPMKDIFTRAYFTAQDNKPNYSNLAKLRLFLSPYRDFCLQRFFTMITLKLSESSQVSL